MNNITKLDSQNMIDSIGMLGQQVEHAWKEVKKIKLPKNYKQIDKVALFGMGGSMLGLDVVKNLFAENIKVPLEIVSNYNVPAYVNSKTLVILSSYSGSTEEVVNASRTVLKKTKKVCVVTTGKNLKRLAAKNNLPIYLIDPVYNPCGQPRIAIGYSIIGILGLFKKLNLIKIADQEIKDITIYLSKNKKSLENKAMVDAKKIKKKIPMLAGSEFLLGNVHVTTNQINENGKNMATRFEIPELNHHLMEGLGNPKNNSANLFFVLINSNLYHKRNQIRYQVTKKVLNKNKIKFLEFKPKAKNKLLQSFEALQWGSYLSFYIAVNNNIDPSPIPYVDYFKNELKK